MMGQWNFTLTSATAQRMAKFVNVMGVTNCSDTFGYVDSPLEYDWDENPNLDGTRTISEVKYLLSEVFNSTYKLSSQWKDASGAGLGGIGLPMDVSTWYPFAGVEWVGLERAWQNTWVKKKIGANLCWRLPEGNWIWEGPADPYNTTFIYGDSEAHNGMVFTSEGSHVVDNVGGTEVGMDFGSWVGPSWCEDPWFEAMWDTIDFMGGAIGPFVPEVGAPDFFWELTQMSYLDPLPPYSPVGPIEKDLKLTAMRRPSYRNWPFCSADQDDAYFWYFTTPTGCDWYLWHVVAVGGPKVNLATEYFNDHTWAVFTSEESGTEFEELDDGGIYVFPSGNHYTGDGWSVITIVEDLNLSSYSAIYDEECVGEWYGADAGWFPYQTDLDPTNWDGPTLVEPPAALLIWGMSGWDTRAAANWFAQYRSCFNQLFSNATIQPGGYYKRGVTTIILHTDHVGDVCAEDWQYGIKEILGPPAGRWRLSETAWNVWISAPLSIDW
jgi:hypothetical protein